MIIGGKDPPTIINNAWPKLILILNAEFAPIKQLAMKREIQSVNAWITITENIFLLFIKIVANNIPPHIALITCINNVKGSTKNILGKWTNPNIKEEIIIGFHIEFFSTITNKRMN